MLFNKEGFKVPRVEILFYIFAALYVYTLIAVAQFGIVDDHMMINTLFVNKSIPFFIDPNIGRFYPLDAHEYNIIYLIHNSATTFYIFNAAELIVILFVLYKLIIPVISVQKKHYIFIVLSMLLLTPAFVTAWFRFFVPERDEFVLFLLFIITFTRYCKQARVVPSTLAIVFANLALYYKETGFVMLSTFAFFHLIFAWRDLKFKQKLLDGMLLASSIIFLLVYYVVIFIHRGKHSYGESLSNHSLIFAKNIFNFLLSDPFLIILLPVLVTYRIFIILSKSGKTEPTYDSLLIASFMYVLSYFALNICAYHYLLPAYAFGIVGMIFFLFQKAYLKIVPIKIAAMLSMLIFSISALPVGVYLISFYKNVPRNFQRTLDYLEGYMPTQNHRVNVYLDGVNRGSSNEIYTSYIKYLNFRGVGNLSFDFKSADTSDNQLLFSKGNLSSPYTIFQTPAITLPESGDLLILTPYSKKLFNDEYLNKIKKEYELLYHADSLFPVPNISIKSLIKYSLIGKVSSEKMLSDNIFGTPLDFYIFRKK